MKNPYIHDAIRNAVLPDLPHDSDLAEHYAQHGEDLTIVGLLSAWMSEKSDKKISDLTYLEIGANHPIYLSSTYLLYHRYGMRGVLVEANPDLIEDLQKTRPDDTILPIAVTNEAREEVTLIVPDANTIATLVPEHLEAWQYGGDDNQRHITVKAQRINDILTQHFTEAPPAYLSIDIEGHDLEVLADMDFEKFRPLIIQIESSNHFIVDHDKHICAFLQQKNYHLIAKININLIFVSDDFFQTLPPPHWTGKHHFITPAIFYKKIQEKTQPQTQTPFKDPPQLH